MKIGFDKEDGNVRGNPCNQANHLTYVRFSSFHRSGYNNLNSPAFCFQLFLDGVSWVLWVIISVLEDQDMCNSEVSVRLKLV